MKPFLILACAVFAANSLPADPYSAAIQQAKRVANQETAANRQLMNNPPPATPVQAAPAQPPDPELQATLLNIQHLQGDFDTFARLTNAAAITTEIQGLTNDLATAALGTKPSQPSLAKLGDDLAAVLVGNRKLRAAASQARANVPCRLQRRASDAGPAANDFHRGSKDLDRRRSVSR